MLADLTSYPRWWPQMRTVREVAPDVYDIACRSGLPFWLRFRTTVEARDPEQGRLRGHLAGDLAGQANTELTATETGTEILYQQTVELTPPLLRAASALGGRRFLIANHDRMMRSGAVGLARLMGV